MICTDEDALICDLAETYHIYDYKKLPIKTVASLSCGLGDNSRIKRKMADQQFTLEQLLLISILDKLNVLIWQNTRDGQRGRKVPKSILDQLTNKEENNVLSFKTPEEFEKMRAKIIEGE